MINNESTTIKCDRRVIRTKRAIRNAFAKLLTMKNIDEITIKDIADEADVNRKTVYNYYNGIYELQDEIENDIVASFEDVMSDVDLSGDSATEIVFERLTDTINKDFEFYSHLLDVNVNSMLVRKMINSLKNLTKEAFIIQHLFPKEKLDVIVDFVGYGILGAYQGWLSSGRQRPIEEISKDVSRLVNNGMAALK